MPSFGGAEWFLYSAIGIVFFLSNVIACDNIRREIIIEGPTKVLASPGCSYHDKIKVIAILNKGDKVRVLGEQMLKACTVYKIKIADERVGYVTIGGESRPFEFYNTSMFAVVDDSTNLMSRPDSVGTPSNTVIAILQKGDGARVISMSYWKGITYYGIMLDDGRIGYVNVHDKLHMVEEKE